MGELVRYLKLRNVVFAVIFAFFAYFLLPFLVPIILAALFAFALDPMLEPIFRKYKMSRGRMSLAVLSGLMLALFLPIALLFGRTLSRLSSPEARTQLKDSIFASLATVRDFFASVINRLSEGVGTEFAAELVAQIQNLENLLIQKFTHLLESIGGGIAYFPSLIGSFLVFMATLYVFIAEAPTIQKTVESLLPKETETLAELTTMFQESCQGALFSTVIVGVLQASLLTFATIVLSFGDPWLVFPLAFLTSFIPLIGVGPITVVIGIGAWASGFVWTGIAFFAFSFVVGTSDNILRAYLLGSGEAKLHPVFGLLVIIGAIVMVGLAGLFIGPVVANLGAIVFHRLRQAAAQAAAAEASAME
jgi:predicted PurR-regulated permease PerM